MTVIRTAALVALATVSTPALAQGQGDLLVAPTRVMLDGARGTEVVLNNIGSQTATYRISLELMRMTPEGRLVEVAPDAVNAVEQATLAMISYAPRRVTLAPNQPQVIRVGARLPDGLADGEYRGHLLFRAIPDAVAPTATGAAGPGLSISLTPIYGVSIPVIVRKGSLAASATIGDLAVDRSGATPQLTFRLTRTGTRSVYGNIRITQPGVPKPLYEARGIAVYPELGARTVALPIDPAVAATLIGPVRIDYLEATDGGGVIATATATLR